MQSILLPNASDKIWFQSANWLQRYKCLNYLNTFISKSQSPILDAISDKPRKLIRYFLNPAIVTFYSLIGHFLYNFVSVVNCNSAWHNDRNTRLFLFGTLVFELFLDLISHDAGLDRLLSSKYEQMDQKTQN